MFAKLFERKKPEHEVFLDKYMSENAVRMAANRAKASAAADAIVAQAVDIVQLEAQLELDAAVRLLPKPPR